MSEYEYLCDNCQKNITFNHQGPRKEGQWVLIIQDCPYCNETHYLRTFDGPKPRKMQEKTERLQRAILKAFRYEHPPLTIRRVFYLCESWGIVEKSLSGYRKIQNQIKNMRRAGSIPYWWIADHSRNIIQPDSYSGLSDALTNMHEFYRKDLWQNQNAYVEIWAEKDAISGVLGQVTNEFNVPLYAARGFSSHSFTYVAAEKIKAIGKPTYIYHFGDYDKWGEDAAAAIARELREEHGLDINFERMAVTEGQIREYNLPTRLAKKGDNRKHAVELDAMPIPVLRDLVRNCITQHINEHEWNQLQIIESKEKEVLSEIKRFYGNINVLSD